MQTTQTKGKAKSKTAQAQVKTITYYRPSNRPQAGHNLFAYTHAVLAILGMLDSKAIASLSAFDFLSGKVVRRHHADKFKVIGNSITCTMPEYFSIGEKALDPKRVGASPELSKLFQGYMRDGKPFKEYAATGQAQSVTLTVNKLG